MTKNELWDKIDRLFIDKEEYMKQARRIVENLTDEQVGDMEDNFRDVYPIAAAIYERETGWYLTGSMDDRVRRKARRECNMYKGWI